MVDGATGKGVGVAVIDTGIDGGLPDFTDAAGASRVVASAVTNPRRARRPPTPTATARTSPGIIAGDGTRRAAGDPLAGKLHRHRPRRRTWSRSRRPTTTATATILDAIYGLQFAVDHKDEYNIRVVNLSLASTVAESYLTDPLDAAVEAAYFHGIVVVAAAGNRGTAADAVSYAPGNDPFAITVGAVDDQGTSARNDDAFATWSSRGVTQDGFAKPDIAAPGAHIVSTLAPGSAFPQLCPACVVDGELHAPRRHLDGRAGRLRRRRADAADAPDVDAGPGQVDADRHELATPRRAAASTRSTRCGRCRRRLVAVAGANAGLDAERRSSTRPPATIDYTRSSWGRSSWGTAPGDAGGRLGAVELELRLLGDRRRQRRPNALELEQIVVVDLLGLLRLACGP